MFVLDRTCKEHCSLPIQEQGNLGKMKRKKVGARKERLVSFL